MKAVKKPVTIDFIVYTGTNWRLVYNFIHPEDLMPEIEEDEPTELPYMIKTLEGNMFANVGDYIIKGIKGEFYPCNPDIFKQTYDIIGD